MFRLMGAAAVLALAAANPSFAQDKAQGKGAMKEQASGKDQTRAKGPDKPSAPDHGDHARHNAAAKNVPAKAENANKPAHAENRAKTAERAEPGKASRGNTERGNADKETRVAGPRALAPGRTTARESERSAGAIAGFFGDGRFDRDALYASVPACPPGLAKKNPGCLPPGQAKTRNDVFQGYRYGPALFGIPLRTGGDYAYYDGYLIPRSAGLHYIPLLGGALAVGKVWPVSYPNLPIAEWQADYYGITDPRGYRYADNVIYRIDPGTTAIQSVAALLTGTDFTVGRPLPAGYDVYNVPGPFQSRYADSDEALYRYADGRVYEVDPASMLIARAIELVL